MASQASLIPDSAQRRPLLITLERVFRPDRYVRAFLWFADLSYLQFLCATSFDAADLERFVHYVRMVVRLWMQLIPSASRSNVSSPLPSRPSSPSPLRSVIDPAITLSQPTVRRSRSQTRRARIRDKKCVLTGDLTSEVAHIYPICLESGNYYIKGFWPMMMNAFESATRWQAAIYTGRLVPEYVDQCSNMLCFSPNAHSYQSRGYFALKPISVSENRCELKVQFYWLNQDYEYVINNQQYSVEPPLFHEDHVHRPYSRGPQGATLFNAEDLDNVNSLSSGDIITIRTTDPVSQPLPSFDILEMQWTLQRIVAASGEGIVKNESADLSGMNFDGPADDLFDDERQSRLVRRFFDEWALE